MYCPGCHKALDTSLTSCDRCGWQIALGQCIPRDEHNRIVAEKDAQIARLHDKLCVVKMVIETLRARLETARNDALEDAARRLLRCFPNMGMIDEFAAEIRALKESPDA